MRTESPASALTGGNSGPFGTVLTFTCNSGYALPAGVAAITSECTSAATWSMTSTPVCTPVLCAISEGCEVSAIVEICGVTPATVNGAVGAFATQIAAHSALGAYKDRITHVTAARNAAGSALPGCYDVRFVVLGALDGSEKDTLPDKVTIFVNAQSQTWTTVTAPRVVASVCTSLTAPAHGYVEYSSVPFTYTPANPVSATYRCTVGYTISAASTVLCNVAGAGTVAWSAGVAPTCTLATCPGFEDVWIGLGVQKDTAGAQSIVNQARQVDWAAPVFGDQLAFACIDTLAVKSGPSSPTCVTKPSGAGGSWFPAPSAVAQVLCKCQPGSYMTAVGGGTCELCAANTFSSEAGATACTPCDPSKGESSVPGSAFCERAQVDCPEGTYKDRTMSLCLSCPKKGAICEENKITLLNNWWFDAQKLKDNGNAEVSATTQMLGCLNEFACTTDVRNVTVTCSAGYSGVLCGACELENGYMRSGQLCRECDSYLYNVLFVAGLAAHGICYILYVIAFQDFASDAGDQRPVVLKIAMSFCQMLTVLGVFKARGTALFNELVQRPASIAGGGISSALPLKCLLNSQIYGTFILNLMTPPAVALLTALLIVPVWVCKRVQEAERASRPPLKAPRTKINVIACCKQQPVAFAEGKVWLDVRRKNLGSVFRPGPRFVAVIVFVLFGIYPTLVKSVFAVFRCSEPISGKMYLEDDFTVQCWVGWHPTFVAVAAAAVFVYLFGIPFGLLLILSTNRHRLSEPRFITTFGFVYRGYHTNRGSVVAWESFVMLRKLAVTAITVSSSDPYIQIFVALLLLIVSYGMQERVMPFETQMLNNIEGMGLFSLIFTQIVSIMYLYIDSRAAETGEKDAVLEYIVTGVLLLANVVIVVLMTYSYLVAVVLHLHATNKGYREYHELQTEPNGPLTLHRNPKHTPRERLKEFKTLADVVVYLTPSMDAEMTGEIAEEGDLVVVSESRREYVRARCAKGRFVEWFKRADGTGWMIDRNVRTGEPELELVGRKDDDGSMRQSFWRFEIISSARVPIRAGTASPPFVWSTGESLAPGESVLVDIRFLRTYPCSKRTVTYLHLADRRGWIVEPSRVPDTDWITQRDYVDCALLARLVGQEDLPGALNHIGISEYSTLRALPIYKHAVWPLGEPVAEVPDGETFFVDDRRVLSKRWRTMYLGVGNVWSGTICIPQTRSMCRYTQRNATMLKLADGRGFVLAAASETGASNVQFCGLRTDSVDDAGRSLVRWNYTVAADAPPVPVYATRVEAGASDAAHKHTVVDNAPHLPPIAPLATVTIKSKHIVNTCIVGEIARSESAGVNTSVFVVIGDSLEFDGVYISIPDPTTNAAEFTAKKIRAREDKVAQKMRRSEKRRSKKLHKAERRQSKKLERENRAQRRADVDSSEPARTAAGIFSMPNPMQSYARTSRTEHIGEHITMRANPMASSQNAAVGATTAARPAAALADGDNPMLELEQARLGETSKRQSSALSCVETDGIASATQPGAAPAATPSWFYTEPGGEVLGPAPRESMKMWLREGRFTLLGTMAKRSGTLTWRPMIDVFRLDADGTLYTKAEFKERYNSGKQWTAAIARSTQYGEIKNDALPIARKQAKRLSQRLSVDQ